MNKEQTIFQRLTSVFTPYGIDQNKLSNKYSIQPDEILRTTSKAEFETKTLQARQNKFLGGLWQKVENETFQKAVQYEISRIGGYSDFENMEFYPEIAATLDIMSEESTTVNDIGRVLNIYSNSPRVKGILEDLFFNRLDIHTSLPMWIRNLVKYGDNFVFLNTDDTRGVTGAKQLPNFEIERREGGVYDAVYSRAVNSSEDRDDKVNFYWRGKDLQFQNWQIAHFRLLGDDRRLPYGTSILEKARRIWKLLMLSEDAMLVYRITRAPERRVYKIFVGNIDPEDVQSYINEIANRFKRMPVIDPKTGQLDLRMNVLGNDQDIFVPVREESSPSPIETLPGACIALDTRIPLLDGRTLQLSEIIDEWDNGNRDLWVYSCNPITGELAPLPITWAGETRKNAEVIKITLDNGESITTTPDHKWVHRTNGFVEAKDLVVGDSLMPFYRKTDVNSQFVFDQSIGDYVDFNLILKEFRNRHRGCTSLTYQKKCEQCDGNIKSNRSYTHFDRSKLCSRSCYNKKRSEVYNGSKLTQYKGVKDTIQKCDFCNNEFKKPSQQRFCSKNCSNQSMIKYDVIIKPCMGCEESMTISDNGKNKNFCTLDCKRDFYFKNKNNLSNIRNNRRYYKKHYEIFDLVRKNHDDICQFCFKEKVGKNLDVHHIIASKLFENIEDSFKYENLIPLHGKCHQFRFEDILANDLYNEGYIIKHENSELMISFFIDKINQFYEQLYIDYSESIYSEFEEYLSDKTKNDKNIVHFINLDTRNCSPNNLMIFNNIKDYWDYSKSSFKDLFKNKLSEVEFYNHKITSIEWLKDTIDTGTITVDGNEIYHNYHTFATESGVFIKNSNLGEIADIEYLQRKLFTALRVPKAFLGFDEAQGEGKNLALLDIRFARTINRIQQAVIQELNKIAIIHLLLLGFDDELDNFTITMNNPSTQAQMLRIQNLQQKVTLVKDAVSDIGNGFGTMSLTRARRDILGWSDDDNRQDLLEQRMEKAASAELANTANVIKYTGVFDKVDKLYGDIEIAKMGGVLPEGGEDGEAADTGGGGGGGGGGGFGGGLDLGGGSDVGFEEAQGEEAVGEEIPSPNEGEAVPEAPATETVPEIGESLIRTEKLLTEEIIKLKKQVQPRIDKYKDIYMNRLLESIKTPSEDAKINENKVKMYDKGFKLNNEINEILKDIDGVIKQK